MSEQEPERLPVVDSEPPDGVWAEEHAALAAWEAGLGNALGEVIDRDDDTDNGLAALDRMLDGRPVLGDGRGTA